MPSAGGGYSVMGYCFWFFILGLMSDDDDEDDEKKMMIPLVPFFWRFVYFGAWLDRNRIALVAKILLIHEMRRIGVLI